VNLSCLDSDRVDWRKRHKIKWELTTLGHHLVIGPALARIERLSERLAGAVAGEVAWRAQGEARHKRPNVKRTNIWAWALSEGLCEVEGKAARGEAAPPMKLQGAQWYWQNSSASLTVLPEVPDRLQAVANQACGGDRLQALTWALAEGFAFIERAQRTQQLCMKLGIPYVSPAVRKTPAGVHYLSAGHARARFAARRQAQLRRVAGLAALSLLGQMALSSLADAVPLMGAVQYLRSGDGSDADNGTTWALANATLVGAFADESAGDTIYVSDNHAETQASGMALAPSGTVGNLTRVICVDDTGDPATPTVLAITATVTTTGAFSITWTSGSCYFYGIIFSSSTGSGSNAMTLTATTPWALYFDNCSLRNPATGSGAVIAFGPTGTSSDDCQLFLKDTTIRLPGHANASLTLGQLRLIMEGGSFITSTTPGGAMKATAANPTIAFFRAVDLSLWGSGKFILQNAAGLGEFKFEDCLVNGAVTLFGGGSGPGGVVAWFDNCQGLGGANNMYRRSYEGTVSDLDPNVYRTGGASADGTTPTSWLIQSGAGVSLTTPLYCPWMVFQQDQVGSPVTVNVEVYIDSATLLKNSDIWLEAVYKNTAGQTNAAMATSRVGFLGTAANWPSSSATWELAGNTAGTPQTISVTFTPQEPGPVRVRIAVAIPSVTELWADPVDLAISPSGRQRLISGGDYTWARPDATRLVGGGVLVG